MAQFPANIDLSSLNGSNGFTINGVALGDKFGDSVASAGDINGDGFADVIIGARYAAATNSAVIAPGASYVVFGTASGMPASFDLATLNGSNGFKLSGVEHYSLTGVTTASAGDVNGDGFDDVIVGALLATGSGAGSGVSYVVFGHGGAFSSNIDLGALNGSNGFKINGEAAGDHSASSVHAAGDVNGDGIADLIIGASSAAPNGVDSGASYVVFGHAGASAATFNLSALNGTNGFKISGAAAGDSSGSSVASAGDVNGDGIADVIIGANRADAPGVDSGASYVVFGHTGGFTNIDLATPLNGANGFKISGEAAGNLTGRSVSEAGDVNGDGIADLLVSAGNASPHGVVSGASYVVFGHTGGFAANLNVSSLNGANGFKISGAAAGDQTGTALSSAGDVNGDGFDDVIIGAGYASPHGTYSGASYVVFGHAGGFAANIDVSALDSSNGFKISGVAAGYGGGSKVSTAGDMNGDGFDDLMISSPYADPGAKTNAGTSYVVYGLKPDAAVTRIGTDAGQSLSGGDFNDVLQSLGGNDKLTGNGGADILDGGTGKDTMKGGTGDDTYIVDNIGDKVIERPGDGTGTVKTSLAAYSLASLTGVENLLLLTGGLNATGNQANNALTGNAAKNNLDGGAGKDGLTGGLGKDTMTGGAGSDVFDFNAVKESGKTAAGRDVITDFKHKTDHIDLKDIDAIKGTAKNDKFHFIGTADFHHVKGELHYTKIDLPGKAHDITLVSGDVNGDGNADFSIELSHLVTLTKGDFVL